MSGHLEEKIGVRATIGVGCFLMSSGVFLTSFAIRHSLPLSALTYGLMFGVGVAFAYAPPLTVAMKWYPRSKGMALGVVLGGFGFGSFIFNQVQTAYLNPKNLKLDDGQYYTNDEVLGKVPSVFLLLGSIYTVIQVGGWNPRNPRET